MKVIGIEGLVGAGKTTICKGLLNEIPNSVLFHGGNLYRTVVASMANNYKDIDSLIENAKDIDIKEMMDMLNIEMVIENRETVFYVDGEKINENFIQSKEISLAVSSVAGKANEENLYKYARQLIDEFKSMYNVIVSGRDLVKIYPELDYHIFITADLDERIKRKAMQYKTQDLDEIRKNIIKRDELQEKAGYYEIKDFTKVIDVTDCSTPMESIKKVLDVININ